MRGAKLILALRIAATCFVILLAAPVHAALDAVGPTSAQNGFPVWYSDSNGVAMELCLDGDGVTGKCFYDAPVTDPLDPNFAFSQQIGFGPEAFWWSADAGLDLDGIGNRAVLVLALEAAFANENPVDGDQFAFGRLRIRVDAPANGTYTVTHPYGVEVYENVVAGPNAINVTSDIGSFAPDFNGALASDIGPLLTWPGYQTDPALVDPITGNPMYVGDPQVPHVVTGSPFGTNIFRVQGPNGLDVQTNMFAIQGKLYTGTVPTPATVERATYKRSTKGDLAVFAKSTPTALLTLTADPPFPSPLPMIGDSNGNFYRYFKMDDANTLPSLITVTADNSATNVQNTPTAINRTLVDMVTITRASYNPGLKQLTINATSGDALVTPTLTAVGLGNLVNGTLTVSNLITPPSELTVTSTAGGVDTKMVTLNFKEKLQSTPRYLSGSGTWRITGRVVNADPGTLVTVHFGPDLSGPVLGSAMIEPANDNFYRIRVIGSPIVPGINDTVSVETDSGISLLNVPVNLLP